MARPRHSRARLWRQALDARAPGFLDFPDRGFPESVGPGRVSVDSVDWSDGRRIRLRLSLSDRCAASPPLVAVDGTDGHVAVHFYPRARRLWRSRPLVKTKEPGVHRAFVCKYDQVSAVAAIL